MQGELYTPCFFISKADKIAGSFKHYWMRMVFGGEVLE